MKPIKKRGPKPKNESEKKVKATIWVKKKYLSLAKKEILTIEKYYNDKD